MVKLMKQVAGVLAFLLVGMSSCITTANAQSGGTEREVIPFNGQWQFRKKGNETWEKVTVPHTWNAVDMQTSNNYYQGEAFYSKTFKALPEWKDKRVFIRFEGVGSVADLYVNDQYVGEHRGAYSAFSFEITHELKYGEDNTVLVKANNKSREDVIPINNNLFGVYGGIYRNVALIVTGKLAFTSTDYASSGVYIRQQNVSASQADITVKVKIDNKWKKTKEAVLESAVFTDKGELVRTGSMPLKVLPLGTQTFRQQFSLRKPHLWNSLDDPYLYKVVVSLKEKGTVLDQVTLPLGIRKFEIKEGKGLFLNGRHVQLHGITRHQEWWGYGSALSNEQHAQDLALIKEMGANAIRLSHYQQSEYFLSKADSIGFIMWAEIPFVHAISGKEADNAKQQMTELIRQNYHHPSIWVWGLHNEIKSISPDDPGSVLTATLNDLAKTEDPDRYTVSVNGSGDMEKAENGHADIQGINRYFGWYEKTTEALEDWVKELEQKYPDYRVILSEYGCEGNVFQQAENPPTKVDPVNGQFFPEQLETRMHEVQWGIIERHPYLFGSYLWTMFDFAVPSWNRGGIPARNNKGMVTFDRQIKKDVFFWYKANWSKEPVVYISDRRLVNRKNPETNITVYSNRGVPSLFVNGKQMPKPKQGATKVHFIFENITLQKGKNTVRVTASDKGKTIADQVEWTLE